MISCSKIDFHHKILNFQAFPNDPLPFVEVGSKKEATDFQLQVVDMCSKKAFTLFVRGIDLQKIGLSLSIWKKLEPKPERLPRFIQISAIASKYLNRGAPIASKLLAPQFNKFFTERLSYANRILVYGLYDTLIDRISKVKDVPGIYFHRSATNTKIFINLKKTPALGRGSFGKVRQVLWLSAPENESLLVAKKVFKSGENASEHFQHELRALQTFSNKRGIISLIAGGSYKCKEALFLPLYETELLNYLCKLRVQFPLTLKQKLSVTAQWLEGLATISEKGVHGDLSPRNLLLKNLTKEETEAVISDFGSFRSYGKEEVGLTTIQVCSPEYFLEDVVSSKQDVWALGLSLAQFYSNISLPCWTSNKKDMHRWISSLKPNWVLKYLWGQPSFLLDLINDMLDPRPEKRPSAKKAFETFSTGLEAWKFAPKKTYTIQLVENTSPSGKYPVP